MIIDRNNGDRHYFTEVPGGHPQGHPRTAQAALGQKVQVILYDDRIELVPVRPATAMKGFVKGIDTTVVREDDRL